MRIYRTDIGSKIFIGFAVLMFIGFSCFALLDTNAPLFIRVWTIILTLAFLFFLYNLHYYDTKITGDAILTKKVHLSFLNKYQTMKFNEIERVYNEILPFPEMTNIVLVPRDKTKKSVRIMVGFGLPWDVLLDILERLPKDVRIDFEPLLWKIIKNPVTIKKAKKINLIMGIIIMAIVVWFLYFLYSVIIMHRVVFPINYFIGQ